MSNKQEFQLDPNNRVIKGSKFSKERLEENRIRLENTVTRKAVNYIKTFPDIFKVIEFPELVMNRFDINYNNFDRCFSEVFGHTYNTWLRIEAKRRLSIEYGSFKNALEKAKFVD